MHSRPIHGPLRLEFAGALYHVTSRGDRREAIFLDDGDRQSFLELLGQVCARFNWTIHAFCLMTNHYHLLLETPDGNLSQGMRPALGVYTQSFNRRHGRVGDVCQGRFKAILVQKSAYLLELSRYVVLNPVRAGMVADAGDWPWSSYGAVVGTAEPTVRVSLPDDLQTPSRQQGSRVTPPSSTPTSLPSACSQRSSDGVVTAISAAVRLDRRSFYASFGG